MTEPLIQLAIIRDGLTPTVSVEHEFDRLAMREGRIVVSGLLPFYGGETDPKAKQLGFWVIAADPDWLRAKLTAFDRAFFTSSVMAGEAAARTPHPAAPQGARIDDGAHNKRATGEGLSKEPQLT